MNYERQGSDADGSGGVLDGGVIQDSVEGEMK